MKNEALPFGVGGGLVAIKTLLSRDPCVHANTAIEMIDAILKEHPAAPVLEGRDWSLLEATQESLREHMAEIKRLKEAQPAVPDAMTSADIQEHIEYVAGWNDCRQAMLEILKARTELTQPKREWQGLTEDERDTILRSESSIFDMTEAILKAKNT